METSMWAYCPDGNIESVGSEPNWTNLPANAGEFYFPVIDEVPEIESWQIAERKHYTQWTVGAGQVTATYLVRNKTTEEVEAEAQAQEDQIPARVIRSLLADKVADIPADEINDYYAMFPAWRAGVTVTAGMKQQRNGLLYEVIQGHTTQVDWPPEAVPALWKIAFAPTEIPVWFQPSGQHDAWRVGDVVYYPDANGDIWDCTAGDVNGYNSWAPGVFGWTKRV